MTLRTRIILPALLALFLSANLSATSPPVEDVPMTHEEAVAEVIEKRQAKFKELKKAIKNVKDGMKDEEFDKATASAEIIAANARALTELFPKHSYEGDTRAKEKIWDNLEDFESRQQQLITNADALVAASKTGDKKQLKDAFKTTSKTCKGCHMNYRQVF